MKRPIRPEDYLECSFCRYRDKISTYKHICWAGILAGIVLMCLPVAIIILLVVKIFKLY